MATQALRYLSGSDGFIPKSTGQLIAHMRKESEFNLNRYVQYIPTPATVGVYALIGRDEAIRVTNDERYAWEDGDDRPSGESEKIPYQWVEFRTFRRDYPWRLGYQALEQTAKFGAFDPKPLHMDMAVSKCMTNRTYRVQQLLQTAANWPSTNTSDCNTINGGAGKLTQGSDNPDSPNYLAIFKTLVNSAQRIHLLTNGKVRPDKTRTIISPNVARLMAQTSEIQNYCRQSPVSEQLLKEGWDPQYNQWGLPKSYKGFQLVVEDSPFVNINPNTTNESGTAGQVPEAPLSTSGRQYIWQDSSAVMVAQPGSIDGEYNSPSYSTVQVYHYEGLAQVEAFESQEHRRISGHVVENIKEVLAAPFSGFCITGIA